MKKTMFYLAVALVAAAFGLSAFGAQAFTGMLRGTVTDPSGAVIPGASVTVSGAHFVDIVSTDGTGRYVVTGLAAGHYRVQIHFAGFAPFDKAGFVVSTGQQTEADAQLVISDSKQEITIATSARSEGSGKR